jgi:tetratricopeptide (TPR) repeat protein
MKKALYLICPIVFGSFVMAVVKKNSDAITDTRSSGFKAADVLGCAPGAGDVTADITGKFIQLMPGWGAHSYKISTMSDSAQIYFDQGLSMYFSYHMREAIASFKEAARFDSSCAMAYWGQALAMGPTYNFGYSYKMNPSVPGVLEVMNRRAATGTGKERELVQVMNTRYDVTDTADKERKQLNVAYAEALKPLLVKYPSDLDIKALYTDAVMLVHPWDFWNNNGTPKAWTPELVRYCEEILQKDPRHPAGLHYYIHVTEASRKPEVALSSADSLLKLYPGIAHMVHMSSHEYERIGYYAKGVAANEKADVSLGVYDSLAKGMFPQRHVPHYYAVDAYCAFSGAMYKRGMEKTLALRGLVHPTAEAHYLQYQYMYPEVALVRLGKWKELLADTTTVPAEWSFAGVLQHFAKGMAAARTGDWAAAETHLKELQDKKGDESLKEKFVPHTSSPYECALVAEGILQANILFGRKQYGAAVRSLESAIRAEDSLLYSEPKLWLLPARQYLGAFLLQMGKPKEAEKIYRDDLSWNPGNGWSLVGLYQALKKQRKTKELAALKKRYTASFSEAEVVPGRSAY